MTSNTRKADQLGYPARLLLIDSSTDRRYIADAIPADDLPDLDRDIGACCYLGQHARPRYIVDGREEPAFDPTIPDDLFAEGWFWNGGWLVHYNVPPEEGGAGLAIGMPRESLDEIWSQARKCDQARIAYQADVAESAATEQKKAAKPVKKPKQQKPATPPKEIKVEAPAPPPTVVHAVVVEGAGLSTSRKSIEQLAMW